MYTKTNNYSGVNTTKGDFQLLRLQSAELVVPLVKGVQEQQSQIKTQQQ